MIEMKNSVMDTDIKNEPFIFANENAFYKYVILVEWTYGSLITRNNMTSNGFEHKTEWRG